MQDYKYDIEFIIPVSMKGVFAERLKYFLQKGLSNCGEYKILINFLVGTELKDAEFSYLWADFDEWQNNFTKNTEVRKISSEVNHCSAKVYNFYVNYTDFGQSKWIIRMDDDSLTNVDLLMKFLNNLDPKNYYYFTAQHADGDLVVALDILKKYNKYEKLMGEIDHEVEIAVLSNATFEKVIKENRTELTSRSTIQAGYTDQLFCYLSKITGIFPVILRMLAADPRIMQFIAGRCAHIHHISPDRNPGFLEIYDTFLENNSQDFCGSAFAYAKKTFQQKTIDYDKMSVIVLEKNGILFSKEKFENRESFWTYNSKNKTLIFYDCYGNKLYDFKNFDKDKKNISNFKNCEIMLRSINLD